MQKNKKVYFFIRNMSRLRSQYIAWTIIFSAKPFRYETYHFWIYLTENDYKNPTN